MKSKFSISGAFRDRKFKYSGTATILVITVIVATLIVNLLCSLLPYKVDVTANKFFSISNKTLSVLKGVEDDIDIYFLYPAGSENTNVMEIVSRYESACAKIKAKQIDPISNPGFADKYKTDDNKYSTTPVAGSVIVECKAKDRFVVLTSSDMYNYSYNDEGTMTAAYFVAEQAFTSAITAVTMKETYNVAVLTGHNEDTLPESVIKILKSQFFNIFDLDLKTEKEIPVGTDVIIFNQPEFDILEDEKNIIMDFLDVNDTCGSAIFLMGKATGETPNIDSIMKYYGLVLDKKTIYEEDTTKYVGGAKYALQLAYQNTPATEQVGVSQRLYFNKAKPIYVDEMRRTSIGVSYLAITSDKAWASDKPKEGTIEKEDGDTIISEGGSGFSPAIVVTEYNRDYTDQTRLLVVNCANFMSLSDEMINNYANDEIFYASLLWGLNSQNAMVTITPKYSIISTHTLPTSGLYTYGIVIGIIVPLAVLGAGLVVYLKRRHL